MKEQHTYLKYTRSALDSIPDETDWERVDALTDQEIDAAASSDADDPPTDELSGRMLPQSCQRTSEFSY